MVSNTFSVRCPLSTETITLPRFFASPRNRSPLPTTMSATIISPMSCISSWLLSVDSRSRLASSPPVPASVLMSISVLALTISDITTKSWASVSGFQLAWPGWPCAGRCGARGWHSASRLPYSAVPFLTTRDVGAVRPNSRISRSAATICSPDSSSLAAFLPNVGLATAVITGPLFGWECMM